MLLSVTENPEFNEVIHQFNNETDLKLKQRVVYALLAKRSARRFTLVNLLALLEGFDEGFLIHSFVVVCERVDGLFLCKGGERLRVIRTS